MDQSVGRREPPSGSARINGSAVRTFRQQAGFTQNVLAVRAGYTDKLIRKAEASGVLRIKTILDLADALCTERQTVTTSDLLFQSEVVARKLLQWLASSQSLGTSELQELLSTNIRLEVVGKSQQIPFAGNCLGLVRATRFHSLWHASFQLVTVAPEKTRVFLDGKEACLYAQLKIQTKRRGRAGSVSVRRTHWGFAGGQLPASSAERRSAAAILLRRFWRSSRLRLATRRASSIR